MSGAAVSAKPPGRGIGPRIMASRTRAGRTFSGKTSAEATRLIPASAATEPGSAAVRVSPTAKTAASTA